MSKGLVHISVPLSRVLENLTMSELIGQSAPTPRKILDIPMLEDSSIPDDEIRVMGARGAVRITNIKEEADGKGKEPGAAE